MKIPIAKPYITEEDIASVARCLREERLSQGEYVNTFEKIFAQYVGTDYAVAISSGTTALHTALIALGIKEGDEVIVPSFSFIATANCILYQNAKPVFVDIDLKTYNIDTEKIVEKITSKTKAIIAVHYAGQPCDMDRINEIAKDYKLKVIEDAAEAHGAMYKGRRVGSLGDVACFSFYPNKNMTTGEGGMITTNEESVARRAVMLKSHGQDTRYHHVILGYNYRMTDIQASLGISQLRKLEFVIEEKVKKARYYDEEIMKLFSMVQIPHVNPNVKHTYMFYSVGFANNSVRDSVRQRLELSGVETRIAFPPIHLQPIYRELFGFKEGYLDVTENVAQRILSLPIYPQMTINEQDFVIKAIGEAL